MQFNFALFVQCRLRSTLSPGALQKPSEKDKYLQEYWKNSRKYSVWTEQQQEALQRTRLVGEVLLTAPLAENVRERALQYRNFNRATTLQLHQLVSQFKVSGSLPNWFSRVNRVWVRCEPDGADGSQRC